MTDTLTRLAAALADRVFGIALAVPQAGGRRLTHTGLTLRTSRARSAGGGGPCRRM